MNIVIFGLGYVGFTAACCIASQGHSVVGVDVSNKKVEAINAGEPPIIEPKVAEMLREGLDKGLIRACTEINGSLDDADLAIICVGTPSGPDGSHNMGYVADVSRQVANAIADGPVRSKPITIAFRSTFRPGTVDKLIAPIFSAALSPQQLDQVHFVYNPEFLREGTAVDDYFHPPKIVIGTADAKPDARMENLNEGIDAPVFYVPFRESEITKFVDNSWHAVKVAFANEIGRVCLNLGISAETMHEIFVSDTKLNISPYYTRPGGAFGGSCLPKDVRALQYIGSDTGANLHLIDSLLRSNEAHKHRLFEYATQDLEPGATVLIVGLAFKAATDDLRESPNVDLARKLLDAGYAVEVFDPAIQAEMLVGANLGYAYSQLPSLEKLLVSKERAETAQYSRVLVNNATIKGLDLPENSDLRNLGALK